MDDNSKKEEIIKSAANCFLRFGFSKTTMTNIGQGAGLNKASLYYYYKDKTAIFKEVVLAEYTRHNILLNEKLKDSSFYYEKILTVLTETINLNNLTCNTFQLLPEEMKNLKGDAKELFETIKNMNINLLTVLIEEGKKSGEFFSCNSLEVAQNILMIMDALLNLSCPLFMAPDEREKSYEKVKKDLVFTVGLMLKGISN